MAKAIRYQGLELLVGVDDKFSDVDGASSGLDRRFLALCDNLFNLPILHTTWQHFISFTVKASQ